MADGAVLTPQNSRFLFNLIPMAFGRAPGSYFTFAYNRADRVTYSVGVDGTGYYVTTGDLSATMTLSVLPNSPENDILAAAYVLQMNAPDGLRFPLFVQRGLAIYTGTGLIAGEPPLEYSDGATVNAWKIVSTRMVGKQGGMPLAPLAPP